MEAEPSKASLNGIIIYALIHKKDKGKKVIAGKKAIWQVLQKKNMRQKLMIYHSADLLLLCLCWSADDQTHSNKEGADGMLNSAGIQRSDSKISFNKSFLKIFNDYQLYLLILPSFVYIIIFHYIPMYGMQIAFRDFRSDLGFSGSPWIGLKHFITFFEHPTFWELIKNTLGISIYQLIAGFPVPIILACMLNEVRSKHFKRTVQMVTYAPHFISVVVMCGMIILFLNQDKGVINHIIDLFGGQRQNFIEKPEWFKTVYVFSGIWQSAGWGSIIYMAALSGVDSEVIESVRIDGANRLQKIWHIDLPTIAPTILILLILNIGNLLSVGFEKVLLLQNPLNMETADVISTYVYRMGIIKGQFSYTSAVGLFNSVCNFMLLILFNKLSKAFSETGLW